MRTLRSHALFSPDAAPAGAQARSSAKETVVSIVIAFIMAFVFRGFVVEAFLIPTGSMAPTLLGANLLFHSDQTGVTWPTNYDVMNRANTDDRGNPRAVQNRVMVDDPITREKTEAPKKTLRWGDRIFVMKYLGDINPPQRWDCIVFKNPNDPPQNYIKRLIGLPGEQVALVDGDVFTRSRRDDDPQDANQWSLPGWTIARKPDMAQRSMWQMVFDSQYSPREPVKDGRRWWTPPWAGGDDGGNTAGWTLNDDGTYDYKGRGPTRLVWKAPVTDFYAYDLTMSGNGIFPVSDIRMSAGVKPVSAGSRVSAVLQTRKHEFRAEVSGADVKVQMRPMQIDENAPQDEWSLLAEGTLKDPLAAGSVTNIEFWHVDQSVQVWINDALIAEGSYDWTPQQRLENTLDRSLESIAKSRVALIETGLYPAPRIRWEFDGGDISLERVALWRDIYYQPDLYDSGPAFVHPKGGEPALATHPAQPLALTNSQFFVCGDNSPASLDARKWAPPHPWVADIDPTMGVVHRDLIIGRAFFVYFPAPHRVWGLPVPDVGRMRWVW